MERPRLKHRWTLGGLMILIALVALPLTLYVRSLREVEQQRLAAEAVRDQTRARYARATQTAHEQRKVLSDSSDFRFPPAAPETKGLPR